MNGRIFDPVLARFLSADPNIDGVSDSQGYNRYSYVHNNPLNATDPSGYLSLKEVGMIAAVVVAAVVTAGAAVAAVAAMQGVAVGGLSGGLALLAGTHATLSLTTFGAVVAGAAGGFASGFAGSLLNGGSIGDAFKAGVVGAVVGGVSAGLAHGIGTLAQDGGWNWFEKAIAHGSAQGLVTEAAGGEFRHGFYAGAFSSALAGPIAEYTPGGAAGQIVAAAVVGGTASAIGGGKFANGAASGAFTHLFNFLGHQEEIEVMFYSASLSDDERAHIVLAADRLGIEAVPIVDARSLADWFKENPGTYKSIAFMDHTERARFGIGKEMWDASHPVWNEVKYWLDDKAKVYILGCRVAKGEAGQKFIDGLSKALDGRKVYGSPHRVGTSELVDKAGNRHGWAFVQVREMLDPAGPGKTLKGWEWYESK